MEYLMGYDRSYDRSYERWVLRLRLIGVPGSNARIKRFNRYSYHATYTHPLHHRRSMLQLSSVLSICLAHRSQSSTYPSSMGRGRKKNQPNEGPCARQLLARRATNILNKGQWTTRCCMNSPRWMCVTWIFLSPSIFNVQVSYLERRCIYSRCAFPPNMKLGYWKLREQWTTRCCMNSPRWMCFNWIFVLRQVSISKFHIWSEGVSIADAPSLQIWNWDIENWRSSGRQGPVRHNNNKYFMSSSFVSCYFPTWP